MKPTLLIADDHPAARAELRRALEGAFEIVAEAVDGQETVELCKKHAPQLVVLDIAMPKMSGIDAIHAMGEQCDPVPTVVVVSGIREDNVVLQALEAGACDYLFKPIDGDALRQVLQQFVKLVA